MAHAVLRLDNVAGTKNPVYLKSAKFYNGSTATAIDNAALVVLGEKDSREVYKATAPAAGAKAADICLVAGVELFYDQTITRYLTEWENAADKAVRVIKLALGADEFSATVDAFDGTPAVGKYVGFAAGKTKIQVQDAKDDSTIGIIRHVETTGWGDGAYTYYMIETLG